MTVTSILLGPSGQFQYSFVQPDQTEGFLSKTRGFVYPAAADHTAVVVLAHPCKDFAQSIAQLKCANEAIGVPLDRWIPILVVEALLSDRRDTLKINLLETFDDLIQDLPPLDAEVLQVIQTRIVPRIVQLILKCQYYATAQNRVLFALLRELRKEREEIDYAFLIRCLGAFSHIKFEGSLPVPCAKCFVFHRGPPCAFGTGEFLCAACGSTAHRTLLCDTCSEAEICAAWCSRKPAKKRARSHYGSPKPVQEYDEKDFHEARKAAELDVYQLKLRDLLHPLLTDPTATTPVLDHLKATIVGQDREKILKSLNTLHTHCRAAIVKHQTDTAVKDFVVLEHLDKPNFLDLYLPPTSAEHASRPIPSFSLQPAGETLTTNGCKAYSGTGTHLLDIFGGADLSNDDNLNAAWNEDPDLFTRMIFYIRSIHEGKGDRWKAYRLVEWLYEHHPRTLIANLEAFVTPLCTVKGYAAGGVVVERKATHGYYKDLLSILLHLSGYTHEATADKRFKTAMTQRKWLGSQKKKRRHCEEETVPCLDDDVRQKLLTDPKYQALHTAVARIFVEHIRQAEQTPVDSASDKLVCLVAKWAPSLESGFDKRTFIGSSIAQLLTQDHPIECANLDAAEILLHRRNLYASRISKLRSRGLLVERLIGTQQFDKIVFPSVPAICHKKHEATFLYKDTTHYVEYLKEVLDGKKQVKGKTLLPHAILHEVYKATNNNKARPHHTHKWATISDPENVLIALAGASIARWQDMEQHVALQGTLSDTIVVSDVSGSMGCLVSGVESPIWPCLALSLLVSRTAVGPWAEHVITFHEKPSLQKIPKDLPINQALEKLMAIPWGGNTNIVKTFTDVILPMALSNDKKAPKRIIIFSDMQFDQATTCDGFNVTAHRRVSKMFEEAGVEMPELVYWNLQGEAQNFPVTASTPGTTLLQGFSPALFKLFLGKDETHESEDEEAAAAMAEAGIELTKQKVEETPLSKMLKALNGESFQSIWAAKD